MKREIESKVLCQDCVFHEKDKDNPKWVWCELFEVYKDRRGYCDESALMGEDDE